MKKKLLVLIAASAISVSVVACSKEADTEPAGTLQKQQANNNTTNSKNETGIDTKTTQQTKEETQSQEQSMTENEKLVYELFQFHLNHNKFGKYVKSVEQRGKTLIVTLDNSYNEMKKAQPFNIRYNQDTFPDLYDYYVKNGDFSDLNAYLITRTTYALANYPQLDRVIINTPKNKEGKYHIADVKRDELNLVLGFDVSTLAKEKGDEDLGEKFTTEFADEYTYKLSDDFTDSNTRFVNKFIQTVNAPGRVSEESLAIIDTYYLPLEERPTMSELFEDAISSMPNAQYITDNFKATSDGIKVSLSKSIVEEKGELETKKALAYTTGRLLAQFPELQNITISADTFVLKVNRSELTQLLGYDIATLVNIDTGEIDDWSAWDSKYANVYVTGTKLDTYIKKFS